MDDLIEAMKVGLSKACELTEIILNTLSLIFIITGLADALREGLPAVRLDRGAHPLHSRLRVTLGGWLLVALEFQLAADIVGTIISPSNVHLIQLGAIALIRTLLNYFLVREMKEERK